MIEQLKDKSKTVTQLENELSTTKKETIFLDTKIIVNSRFDNFFEFLDTKDTKIGDTFNEKNFDTLLNKRALKYKFSTVNNMRKKVLNFLLKDSLNSKVQTTSDLYKNTTSKEMIKKVLFGLYTLFLLLTSLSYFNFLSPIVISTFILIFIPIAFVFLTKITSIRESIFMLSLKDFMNSFANKYKNADFKEKEFSGYKESFDNNSLIPFETRFQFGLENVYNSEIIIPFIPDFLKNNTQKEYLELFLINYGKLQTQSHVLSLKNIDFNNLDKLNNEQLLEIKNELDKKSIDLANKKQKSVNTLNTVIGKIEECETKIKERFSSYGTYITRSDIQNTEKLKKIFVSSL